jgi:toxin secretion/phage lysis holin
MNNIMKLESVQYIVTLFASTCENFWTKCITSFIFSYYVFFFDVHLIEASKALLVLIIVDFFTALFAAKKSGEEIKSSKIFRTPLKILIYFMLVSVSNLMETVTPILSIIDETMMTFLALTELISIIENTGRMGFAIPQKLLNKLHELRDEK